MLVDGRKIAEEIREELAGSFSKPSSDDFYPPALSIFWVGDELAMAKFISAKSRFAEAIGVEIHLNNIKKEEAVTQKIIEAIVEAKSDHFVRGVVVQLPLPKDIDTEKVLQAIPKELDVDALGPSPLVEAPVAAAVAEILKRVGLSVRGRKVLVIGQGRLVGRPVAEMFRCQGANVRIADINTKDLSSLTLDSEIIVSGVGVPGLVRPEMVREGVVLIDAETSESASKLVGDIDPACAFKAALFTPTPGGLGPVTVAMLFQNLLKLIELQASPK